MRILTFPNLLTLIRLLFIPYFIVLAFQDRFLAAAILLGVLGSTDWVDGQVARRFNQVSSFGKVFDPTVDRLLLLSAGLTLILLHAIPLWFALLVLTRELLISLCALYIYAQGAPRIDVQLVGKAGAFSLMIAMPLFLASLDPNVPSYALTLAWIFGLIGTALSFYSLRSYEHLAIIALRSKRPRS